MNRFVSVPRRTLGLFQLSSKVDLLSHLQRPVGSKHPELGHGEGRIHSHVSVQISNLRLKFTKSQIYIQIFATMYKLFKKIFGGDYYLKSIPIVLNISIFDSLICKLDIL